MSKLQVIALAIALTAGAAGLLCIPYFLDPKQNETEITEEDINDFRAKLESQNWELERHGLLVGNVNLGNKKP